jgi:hypothetical protein
LAGQHRLLEEQQPGTAAEVPGLPTEIDVATTAEYAQVLAGARRCPRRWRGRWNISCNLQLKFLERHPA